MNFSTLLAGTQSDSLTGTLPILRIVLFCIVILCAITIIVTTIMQSNNSNEGIDSLMTSQESYYSKNKGSSRDGKLKIITIVMAVIAILCIIAFFITEIFNKRG